MEFGETMNVKVKVKRLHGDVKLPVYIHPGDAGMDVYSRETRTLEQGEPHLFKTGLSLELPEGYVAIINERSGMAVKGIKVLGGVIEHTYRGEYGVVLVNTSNNEFLVRPGDRIAQILILPVATAEIEEVHELSPSPRGDNGFGSSGR